MSLKAPDLSFCYTDTSRKSSREIIQLRSNASTVPTTVKEEGEIYESRVLAVEKRKKREEEEAVLKSETFCKNTNIEGVVKSRFTKNILNTFLLTALTLLGKLKEFFNYLNQKYDFLALFRLERLRSTLQLLMVFFKKEVKRETLDRW